jgi:multiple sugar transport system permease protein
MVSNRNNPVNLVGSFLKYSVLIVLSLWMLLPFYWMISASLMSSQEIIQMPPPLVPSDPQWGNYSRVSEVADLGRAYLNSLLVTGLTVLGILFTSSLAGFAFAKYQFPARDVLFAMILATMMIPFFVILIPVFYVVRVFGWTDSYAGLIMPGLVSAYGIFMMRQFILSLPDELLDAARIDGANEFRIYWQIVLPLTGPALATLAVFNMIGVWNSFLWPLLVAQSPELYTVPLALNNLRTFGMESQVLNLQMAGTVASVIPTLVVFIFLQRYFTQGIALTGLKG